jgi:hypothetical protein
MLKRSTVTLQLRKAERKTLLRHGILFVAVFHLIAQLFYGLPRTLSRTDSDRDVLAYFLAKERIQNHESAYPPTVEMVPYEANTPIYLYPPVFSSLLSLFPSTSFIDFAEYWTLLVYAAFWVYAAVLTAVAVGRATFGSTLVTGLILGLFPGTQRALSLGQVDPLLWALFSMALVFPAMMGASAMGVSLVKLWGFWPLIIALREGRSTWLGALAMLAAGVGVGSLGMGCVEFFTSGWYWLTRVLPSLSQGSWDTDNWSLSFSLLRVLHVVGVWDYASGMLPWWARLWLMVSSVAAPIIAILLLRRRILVVRFSAVASATILFAPICWTSYLPLLLTLFAALLSEKRPSWLTAIAETGVSASSAL